MPNFELAPEFGSMHGVFRKESGASIRKFRPWTDASDDGHSLTPCFPSADIMLFGVIRRMVLGAFRWRNKKDTSGWACG